jgi:hypothetical protein
MTTAGREIAAVSLRVSQDVGHGGRYYQYRIGRPRGSCEVTVTIGTPFPAPGERSSRPCAMTQILHKDGREVADFLTRLARVYRVFELEGRDCPHAFLHPTFYSFGFTDSEGRGHEFEYSIEAGRHHDDTYRKLVEEFEQFFEAERIARSLYEGEIKPPEPPGRGHRLRRKFWWLTSLFFNR